jgi:hypothetical protein
MSGTANALIIARATGRPVPISNPDGSPSSLVAYPTGNIGTSGGGFGGAQRPTLPVPPIPPAVTARPVAPSTPFNAVGVAGLPGSPSGPAIAPPAATSWLQRPSLLTNQPVGANTGLFTPTGQPVGATITAPSIPTVNVYPQPQQPVQGTLNQANPNFTAGIQGLPGSPSGPAVAPPGGFPPSHVPDLVVSAQRYRAAHGLATPDDTDALNAESLAAAQAGRTYFDPRLAAQYGQPLAAGAYGPRTDVVNALSLPPANG